MRCQWEMKGTCGLDGAGVVEDFASAVIPCDPKPKYINLLKLPWSESILWPELESQEGQFLYVASSGEEADIRKC